jgi:small-conductance mechanosensitive channel
MGIVGAVVGTLGLLGLVAGIAFKDWVANYLPAMMLGFHPPFKAGDLVQGATVLMTPDGEELRLPNASLFQETLINYSQHRERRLRVPVPLSPHADMRRAQEVGQRALLELHGIERDPPPFMRTRALGRDMVEVEFFAWVDQDAVNFRTAESRARRAVLEALDAGGVPLPPDTLLVRWDHRPGPNRDERTTADDAAEQLDQAFMDRQLERELARSRTDGERDLLAEGAAPGSASTSSS